MGVTIVAYLGFFVALAFGLLGVAALLLAPGRDAVRAGIPALSLLPGGAVGVVLVAFAALVAATGWGMLRKRTWAWGAALGLVALSAVPDVARLAGRDWGGLVGILVVALLVAYLMRPEVRAWFHATDAT
jgi:hypothetical protein